MKYLLLFICSFYSLATPCDIMPFVRADYHAIKTQQQLEAFLLRYQSGNCEAVIPYVASAIMQKAKYSFWPKTKLKQFVQGKKLLENYIQQYPESVEARYVRVLIQGNTPKILKYKNNISTDIDFIKSNIDTAGLPAEYVDLILVNIKKLD